MTDLDKVKEIIKLGIVVAVGAAALLLLSYNGLVARAKSQEMTGAKITKEFRCEKYSMVEHRLKADKFTMSSWWINEQGHPVQLFVKVAMTDAQVELVEKLQVNGDLMGCLASTGGGARIDESFFRGLLGEKARGGGGN